MPEEQIPTLEQLRQQHQDPDALEQAAEAARGQHEARMHSVHAEVGQSVMSASQERRWQAHSTAAAELRTFLADQRAARLRDSRQRWQSTTFGPAEPVGAGEHPARAVALRHADDAHRSGRLSDAAREKVEQLVSSGSAEQRGTMAEWLAVAGAPSYRSAFGKLAADPTHGHLTWTGPEHDAYRAVAAWKSGYESRTALVLSGYVLPAALDPTLMLTSAGSSNPLRRLARVVNTATSSWRGITSSGATAEWKDEGVQAADGTPPAAEVEIPVFMSSCDAIYSYEVAQDAIDLEDQLGMAIRDAIDNLQATAFTTGGGTSDPQGIVTGLAGTASEVNGQGSEAIASTDPTDLQNVLPARFSANAMWLSHIAIKNGYAFMETTNGALLFPELRREPSSLLGKPWFECSNMDGAINPAATANNYVLIYGDVRRGFVIVDHIASTVEFLPDFGADGRPTGRRHLFVTSRHGSEVVVPQAMRLLDIPTAA